MKVTHLNGLRALEAALRTGSFRAAAGELGVTPAAVGQQIRTLEDYLGRRLFDRTQAGAKPTADAEAVRSALSTNFSAIGDILNRLRVQPSRKRVAVTLPQSFAENWFTYRLADFYRLESELELRLDASNRMIDLLSEDFDFAIRYCAPPDEGFDSTILFGDYVLPMCTPEFADGHGLGCADAVLDGVPLVHLKNRTPDPTWADWRRWCRDFGFDEPHNDAGLELTHVSSGLQAAIAGQGLVLCGITEAYRAIVDGLLVMPFGPERNCPTGFKYRLVKVTGRNLSSLQRRFEDWVIETSRTFDRSVHTLLATQHGASDVA